MRSGKDSLRLLLNHIDRHNQQACIGKWKLLTDRWIQQRLFHTETSLVLSLQELQQRSYQVDDQFAYETKEK